MGSFRLPGPGGFVDNVVGRVCLGHELTLGAWLCTVSPGRELALGFVGDSSGLFV